MMKSVASVAALGLFLGTLVGCSGIRVVKRTPDGGVVALQGIREDAREKADAYMKSQCAASGYEVLEEGEAVIGSETTSRPQATLLGGTVTRSTSTDRAEWRITFRCKSGGKTAKTQTLIVPL